MDKELPVSAWPEWKIIEKIGEGSFGKVYKAQRTERGKSFYSAIKIINIFRIWLRNVFRKSVPWNTFEETLTLSL